MYITLSLAEATGIAPEALRDKCVRVVLKPGETWDLELDCLQLTLVRAGYEGETGAVSAEVGQKRLASRQWASVKDAMTILRGLVGQAAPGPRPQPRRQPRQIAPALPTTF